MTTRHAAEATHIPGMRLSALLLLLAACGSSAGSTDNGPDPCQTAYFRARDGGVDEIPVPNCVEIRAGVANRCGAAPMPGFIGCCCWDLDSGAASALFRSLDAGR